EFGAAVLRGIAAVAAYDVQAGVDGVAAAQFAHAADHTVHSFSGHQAAQLQHREGIHIPAQLAASVGPVGGGELAGIKAARHDVDFGGVGVIELDEVVVILRALGDDAVGLPD